MEENYAYDPVSALSRRRPQPLSIRNPPAPYFGTEEEYLLGKRWREHKDWGGCVASHLRLVAKIAMRYLRYGLPVAELISEGNLGLMQAVKRFEPERGFRLSTYAMWWIRASIQEYVLSASPRFAGA